VYYEALTNLYTGAACDIGVAALSLGEIYDLPDGAVHAFSTAFAESAALAGFGRFSDAPHIAWGQLALRTATNPNNVLWYPSLSAPQYSAAQSAPQYSAAQALRDVADTTRSDAPLQLTPETAPLPPLGQTRVVTAAPQAFDAGSRHADSSLRTQDVANCASNTKDTKDAGREAMLEHTTTDQDDSVADRDCVGITSSDLLHSSEITDHLAVSDVQASAHSALGASRATRRVTGSLVVHSTADSSSGLSTTTPPVSAASGNKKRLRPSG
jgi:hypothetical protein